MATQTKLGTAAASQPGAAATPRAGLAETILPRLRQALQLRRVVPYLFMLPFVVLFVMFFFVPFIYAAIQGFYHVHYAGGLGFTPPTIEWYGFNNFIKVFQDPNFWAGIERVIVFGLVQIPVMMGLALAMAMLMDSAVIRFRRFFRLAFFVPYAIPGVIAAIMWQFFYNKDTGPITDILNFLHLPTINFVAPNAILWSIANISTWEFTGYQMIIFFAALQAVPQEIYESGRIDGLSEIGIALRLKLPMITPAVILGLLFSMIGTLQLFNEPLIMQVQAPAIGTNFTPAIYAYTTSIVETNYYYGGALITVMAAITFIFSFGFLRLSRRGLGA